MDAGICQAFCFEALFPGGNFERSDGAELSQLWVRPRVNGHNSNRTAGRAVISGRKINY